MVCNLSRFAVSKCGCCVDLPGVAALHLNSCTISRKLSTNKNVTKTETWEVQEAPVFGRAEGEPWKAFVNRVHAELYEKNFVCVEVADFLESQSLPLDNAK